MRRVHANLKTHIYTTHDKHDNKTAKFLKVVEVNLILLFSSQQVRKKNFARQRGTTVYENDTKQQVELHLYVAEYWWRHAWLAGCILVLRNWEGDIRFPDLEVE